MRALIVSCLIVLSSVWGIFRRLMLWINNEDILTTRRIIQVSGVFSKTSKDSSLEKINDIRIMQLDGITGGGSGGSSRTPTDEVINSALRYRVQAPLIDNLLADMGIDGGDLAKMGGLIREASDLQRIAKSAGDGGAEDRKGGGGASGEGRNEDGGDR